MAETKGESGFRVMSMSRALNMAEARLSTIFWR